MKVIIYFKKIYNKNDKLFILNYLKNNKKTYLK